MQQSLIDPRIDAFNNVWFGTQRHLSRLWRELDCLATPILVVADRIATRALWRLVRFCGRLGALIASTLWRLVLRPVLVAVLATTAVVALLGAAGYNPVGARMSVVTSYLPVLNVDWSLSFVMLVSFGVVLTALLPILACSYIHYGRTNTLQRL